MKELIAHLFELKFCFKKNFDNDVPRIIIVLFTSMFLTTPTLEELKQFELPELIDMLARNTLVYIERFREEGVTSTTTSLRQAVINIQMAIDSKKGAEKLLIKN